MIQAVSNMKKVIALLAAFVGITVSAQTGLKKVYQEDVDPIEQIDHAVAKAKADGKFVICQVGGNWCPWCLRFADLIAKDSVISNLIDDNFVYVHANYNPRKSQRAENLEQGKALMKRLNNAGRFGFPVLVVLDGNGSVVHIQDSGLLEEGQGYAYKKVLSFFRGWTPKAVKFYEDMNIDKFAQLISDTSVVVLDVRTAEEFHECHLKEAVNIDVNQDFFLEQAKTILPAGKKIAVYCRSGRRSADACRQLSEVGYDCVNLLGGIHAWMEGKKAVVDGE
jgi:rhodanese-related sulfurtransferase/thioredoxin-related protein